MKKIEIILTLILTTAGILCADEIVTYTSITKGYDIGIYDGVVFAGTDGGLIGYENGSSVIYDTDDGIFKPDIKIVEKDFRNIFWLGHSDCSITLYDIKKKNSDYLDDIEQAGAYSLNAIKSSDKYIYVATSGLLARYRYNTEFGKYEISDINSMTGPVLDVSVSGGNIYMCLNSGIYTISEDAPNINFMGNWTIVSGLETVISFNSLAVDQGKIFVLTDNGLYSVNDQGEAVKETVYDGENLIKGSIDGGTLLVSYEQVDATVVSSVPTDFSAAPEIIFGTTDENFSSFCLADGVLYFTSTGGFSYYVISGDEEYLLSFNVPKAKGIKKIIWDKPSSRLLYLTNYSFSYAETDVMNFYPAMFSARGNGTNFHARGNDLYICTWGAGVNLLEFQSGQYVFQRNYTFGSALEDPVYPVHPGISEDQAGGIWITNWGDPSDSTIVRISSDGQLQNFVTSNFLYGYDIFADQYNNKTWIWLGSSSQSFGAKDGIGVGIYEENKLNIRNILIPEGVIDIARDKGSIVWIGTNNGIKYIDLSLSHPDPSSFSIANVNTIQTGPIGNTIFDVEINSINEKWFATENGISVLSAENDSWRHYVTMYFKDTQNIPGEIIRTNLPDRAINNIEFDDDNGIAIISSYNGLSFLEYGKIFKTGDVKKGEIQTKPSPFINDGSSIMGFYFPEDGNSYDAAKIFDMKGFLIKGGDGSNEFDIRNGWNGKDNDGKTVPSGIYRIIAYNKNERTKNITGKIAVVRK